MRKLLDGAKLPALTNQTWKLVAKVMAMDCKKAYFHVIVVSTLYFDVPFQVQGVCGATTMV